MKKLSFVLQRTFSVSLVGVAAIVGMLASATSQVEQAPGVESWCVSSMPDSDDLLVLEWKPAVHVETQVGDNEFTAIQGVRLEASDGWNAGLPQQLTIARSRFKRSPRTFWAGPPAASGWWGASSMVDGGTSWAEVWTSEKLYEGGGVYNGAHITMRQWGAVALYRPASKVPWRIQVDLCDVRPLVWKGGRFLVGSSGSPDAKFRGIWLAPLDGATTHPADAYEPPFAPLVTSDEIIWGGFAIADDREAPAASTGDNDLVVASLERGKKGPAPLDFRRSTDLENWETWSGVPPGVKAKHGYAFARSGGYAVVATEGEKNAVEVWITLIPGSTWEKAAIDGNLPPSAGRGVELIEAKSGLLIVYREASGGVVVRSVTL